MRPDQRDIDDELRGHLALAIQERIDRGEDPDEARQAALREFGYVAAVRESVRRVWYSRWLDATADFARDMRIGARSLASARGLSAAVVVTLALGIGANAAIFSVVRGVLLRPLVNRGEERLLYIRQSAPGLGAENITFSVPELRDLTARLTTLESVGEFSTLEFTLVGLGEPRLVNAGVVSGSFFEVMGLSAVAGRLLTPADDGADKAGAAVLTHRFWSTTLNSDPTVVGRTIRLGSRTATIVGVLEPSVPYPADTEIIANIVTSPHHLDAAMVTVRAHRMTELFGRLAAGVTLDEARAEITAAHAAVMREHPEAYARDAEVRVSVTPFREQVTSPARPVLILLLIAAGIVFGIACANVANLLLARAVRREDELAVRAALGASRGALRRTLLAESLVLCGAGAALGVALARPLVSVVSRFASRFSVRAQEVTVDPTLLWVGAGLAMLAAVALAWIPRLPHAHAPGGSPSAGVRLTPATNRRLRLFATAQIACSFVLVTGAAAVLSALVTLQQAPAGVELDRVLAIDLPSSSLGMRNSKEEAGYRQIAERLRELPNVEQLGFGSVAPWRDIGRFPSFQFTGDGHAAAAPDGFPHAQPRFVSPAFFVTLGLPLRAGREFSDDDGRGAEPVAIVSQSVADKLFPNGDALNRRVWWSDPLWGKPQPRRIVGVVSDLDDEHIVPGPALTIYMPAAQIGMAGRLFIRTAGDPYLLLPTVNRMVREVLPEQPVERPATLRDIRAEVLAPDRVKAFVVAGFAGMALLIAAVGIAGVLAFSVSARTREFGVRLAVGSTPWHLLLRVLREGVSIVVIGIGTGLAGGYALQQLVAGVLDSVPPPGVVPALVAAAVLVGAALLAALIPAARAARVDVVQALRSE